MTSLAAAVAAREETVLAAERDRPDCAFDRVGVEFDAIVVQESCQTFPVRERVTDDFGGRAATRQQWKLRFEPHPHRVNNLAWSDCAETQADAPAIETASRAAPSPLQVGGVRLHDRPPALESPCRR